MTNTSLREKSIFKTRANPIKLCNKLYQLGALPKRKKTEKGKL